MTSINRLPPFLLLCTLTVIWVSCAQSETIREYPTNLQCPDCPSLPVARVIDGDTFVSDNARVRLFGVDTPERGKPCFKEATRTFRQLAGRKVRVERGPRTVDPGGRNLFYVFTSDGNSIGEILIREGLARAWTRDGQHRAGFMDLEKETRRAGQGCLWMTGKER